MITTNATTVNVPNNNYLQKLDQVAEKIQLWKKERSNKRTQGRNIWQSILDDLTPIMYNYPRFRFKADEDTSSEYFLYAIDFLEEIIKNSIQSEISFSYFFARALRNLYYRFHTDRLRQNKLTIINESDLVKDNNAEYNNDQSLDNLFTKAAFLSPATEYFVPLPNGIPNKEEADNDRTIHLHKFLLEIPILERIIIKTLYGLYLQKDEMQFIEEKYSKQIALKIFQFTLQAKKRLLEENKKRTLILEQLQHLYIIKTRRALNKPEQGNEKNLKLALSKIEPTLTMREISDLLEIPKSSVQRIVQKNIKFLKNKFTLSSPQKNKKTKQRL